jgi:hypothetical protein
MLILLEGECVGMDAWAPKYKGVEESIGTKRKGDQIIDPKLKNRLP